MGVSIATLWWIGVGCSGCARLSEIVTPSALSGGVFGS
jgi:hypothetical protein